MPRPPRGRWISCRPRTTVFKPAGIPASMLQTSRLDLDELEAMHLVDGEGLNQTQAAEQMKISQSTVARLLERGRHKVIHALVQGEAIEMQDGEAPVFFYGPPRRGQCGGPGGMGRGRRRNRGGR